MCDNQAGERERQGTGIRLLSWFPNVIPLQYSPFNSAPFASRPTTTAAADRRHKNATAQEPQEGEPQRDLESRISSDLPQCSKSSTGDF